MLSKTAFERLYQDEEKALYNTVYRWVWQEDEAMDLVQEAFVKLWDTRARVREAEARPFVYKIALNLAANRCRSRKLWRWVGLEDRLFDNGNHETRLVRDEQEAAVRVAIEKLPEKLRRVLVLCRFTEMNQKEIGHLLGIPEGTVASRQHKAIDLLKQAMRGKV